MTIGLGVPLVSTPRKQSITIRPAATADTDFILSLVPRFVDFELPKGRRKRDVLGAIHADIEHALLDMPPRDRFFIATDASGKRAGFLHLQVQLDFFSGVRACHVADLAVAARHDGEGIGSALLARAEKWAKSHRCRLLTLSVFMGNTRARALYEHKGFAVELLRLTKSLDR